MSVPFIIADDQMLAKLDRLDGPVTVCTADGRVLGTYSPTPPAKLNLQPQISEEEIQRRIADTTGKRYTTEEVLAKLRAL